MDPLYDSLPPDTAMRVHLAARLLYETRENRRRVLAAMGIADEEALLGRIRCGEVAEHPAYEHYLAACILRDTHSSARQSMADALNEVNRP